RVDVVADASDPLIPELPLRTGSDGRWYEGSFPADRIMQLDGADADPEMRRDRPAQGKVVDGVGHDRVGVALAPHRNRDTGKAQAGQLVVLVVELFFEAQRPQLIAGAGADIEAVVPPLLERELTDSVGRVFE